MKRTHRISEANVHRCKAQSYYVEGIRQIDKIANNIIAPRNACQESRGYGNSYTVRAREMVALGEQVQKGWDPKEFFRTLESDYGLDFEGFAREIANCLV